MFTHQICHHFSLKTAFSTVPMSSCFKRKSFERDSDFELKTVFSSCGSFSLSVCPSDIEDDVGEIAGNARGRGA